MAKKLIFVLLALIPILCSSFSPEKPSDRRILILLDDFALKSSHSLYFNSLQSRGFDLDFKLADDPKITLQRYGQYLYDALILFCPSIERFGGSIDAAAILDFVDSGHDLIVAADSNASDLIREIATECGVDFDEDPAAMVVDHSGYAVSATEGDHTLIASDDFVKSDVILGSKKIEAPVLFQGIGHSLNPSNSLVLKVLSASPTAYSANPKSKLTSPPSLTGTSISLVSVIQARNNARILVTGSLSMFSNRFFRSAVQKAGSPTKHDKSGNEQFLTELSKWILHERGHLKAVNVQHHKVGEADEPAIYRINDDLEYSVEIYEWSGATWEPYIADDVQEGITTNEQSEMSTETPLRRHRRCNLPSSIKLKTSLWSELSGAVGDLGTYIPIVLALSLVNNLDLTATLIFTALYNIATGLLFGVPMPVQPMKSIAAVAISETPPLTIPQISAAGLSVAAVLLLLGSTGLMSFLYRYLPLPVVRGVQLSQGLSFAFSAIKYIRYQQDLATSKSGPPRPWLGFDGLTVALIAVLFLVLTTGAGDTPLDNHHEEAEQEQEQEEDVVVDRRNRLRVLSVVPAALIVFLFGLLLCFLRDPSIIRDLRFGPSRISVVTITWEDVKIGFVRAAIPQIPLSILNSVIAVCKLSGDLFPEREASVMHVSVSVGIMNFVGCWFGAMPCCHGAGGLAGQYRFGGRSGAAVVFLGIAKLVLALVFGNSFGRILGQFPIGILGVLLLFAGIELAMASKDMNTKQESFVMFVCAAVSLTGSSAALGFFVGIVLYLLLKLREVDCGSCFGLSSSSKSKKTKSSVDEEVSLIA